MTATCSNDIPEREQWLHDNPEALASVMKGLQQAADGDIRVQSPDGLVMKATIAKYSKYCHPLFLEQPLSLSPKKYGVSE